LRIHSRRRAHNWRHHHRHQEGVSRPTPSSDDATTFTVTLDEGWTFTNSEPVTSQSFVDAWSYGASYVFGLRTILDGIENLLRRRAERGYQPWFLTMVISLFLGQRRLTAGACESALTRRRQRTLPKVQSLR
jgi:hypothetical protein